jgi:hypothetical protein
VRGKPKGGEKMSEKLLAEVQERIDRMTEAFREQLVALYAWSNGEHGGNEPTAMQIEERCNDTGDEICGSLCLLFVG